MCGGNWFTPQAIEFLRESARSAVARKGTATTLWRRQMVLGPGKEFALIVPPGLNVAAPAGWSALAIERVRVDAPADTRLKQCDLPSL
jgi:hypothetical protein